MGQPHKHKYWTGKIFPTAKNYYYDLSECLGCAKWKDAFEVNKDFDSILPLLDFHPHATIFALNLLQKTNV